MPSSIGGLFKSSTSLLFYRLILKTDRGLTVSMKEQLSSSVSKIFNWLDLIIRFLVLMVGT
jgi:hypothetical protein